jgi:hypothetical protein
LLKAAESLEDAEEGFLQITNVNSPESFTVKDLVKKLSQIERFDFEVSPLGEEWPVEFWGSTENLSHHLRNWQMVFPDSWATLKNYFIELVGRRRE